MSITLGTLTLPDDLVWEDEFNWSAVKRSSSISLTGALVIQENTQQKGRPITLTGQADSAWMTKEKLNQLRDMVEVPKEKYSLTLHDNQTFTVMFARDQGNPVQAKQVVGYSDPEPTDYYTLTLKLIEV